MIKQGRVELPEIKTNNNNTIQYQIHLSQSLQGHFGSVKILCPCQTQPKNKTVAQYRGSKNQPSLSQLGISIYRAESPSSPSPIREGLNTMFSLVFLLGEAFGIFCTYFGRLKSPFVERTKKKASKDLIKCLFDCIIKKRSVDDYLYIKFHSS